MTSQVLFYLSIAIAIIYTVYLSSKLIRASMHIVHCTTERTKMMEHCTINLCREAEKRMKDKVREC